MSDDASAGAPDATTGKPLDPATLAAKLDAVDSAELAAKRKDYYATWRSLAREEVQKSKAEEESEKHEAEHALGLDKGAPKSEAEEKDMAKREALKEAKKQWEDKKQAEAAMRFTIGNERGVTRVIKPADVEHRPVIVIDGAHGCEYELSGELKAVIKVFISNCEETKVTMRCGTITQHVELSHCTDFELAMGVPTHTVQADLCERLTVRFEQNCLREGDRLYHAGVTGLQVLHWTEDRIEHNYTEHDIEYEYDKKPKEEWQFITHLVDGRLKTERVRQAHGIMPLTEQELSKLVGTSEIDTARLRQAQTKKTGGNEAFASGEFVQACVFYAQAMDLAPNDTPLLAACLSNKAACNLKLGRLEEALEDANACLALDPKHAKAWFRKGMALHAMKRYGPAVQALAEAEKLAPKDKSVKEAIGFAKVLLAKQAREAEETRT